MSGPELMELERARLALRSYGIRSIAAGSSGRRIAVLIADLDAAGENSLVAQRLREMRVTGSGNLPMGAARHDSTAGGDAR